MNDKELADKIVALGVGTKSTKEVPPVHFRYYLMDKIMNAPKAAFTEDQFVRDWRVTGALMEKCKGKEYLFGLSFDHKDNLWSAHFSDEYKDSDSLPRAICEAYVEALSHE